MDPSLVAFAVPVALAGGAFIFLAIRAVVSARRAVSWPTVPAVVLSFGVDIIGLYRTFPTSGVSRTARITYAYDLDGVRHHGHRLRYGIWRFGGSPTAQLDADRVTYAPGQSISVHVSPENPAEAVADPTYDSVAVMTCALLGMLFLASAAWLLAASAGWVAL